MTTIKRFEDLECWIETRKLCSIIYKYMIRDPFRKDFALADQISKSSGSAKDNIAEGFERGGNKEFIQFLFISKSSAAEAQSQLYRALDRDYIGQDEFEKAYQQALKVGKLDQGLISYLKTSGMKGRKYN
ncbi:four helix bundle protein [Bacteroidota bacterium]